MMQKITGIILAILFVIVPVLAQRPDNEYPVSRTAVRFAPLHIYLDSANQALAAWQFELKTTSGQIKIVGVEGGQHPAFAEAPYYDPAALASDRIIVAAFSTQQDLPKGKTRIATLHLQIIGDVEPEYELKLIVSADSNGKEIPAKITFEKGE